jgi:hypothetical protein
MMELLGFSWVRGFQPAKNQCGEYDICTAKTKVSPQQEATKLQPLKLMKL